MPGRIEPAGIDEQRVRCRCDRRPRCRPAAARPSCVRCAQRDSDRWRQPPRPRRTFACASSPGRSLIRYIADSTRSRRTGSPVLVGERAASATSPSTLDSPFTCTSSSVPGSTSKIHVAHRRRPATADTRSRAAGHARDRTPSSVPRPVPVRRATRRGASSATAISALSCAASRSRQRLTLAARRSTSAACRSLRVPPA